MTWVKLDDSYWDNPTNRELGPAGRDLFGAGLAYCAKGLTDGRIPKADLPLVLALAQAKPALVRRLIDAGRWIDQGDHYEVDGYLDYQLSKAQVTASREREREKKRRQRAAGGQAVDQDTNGRFVPRGTTQGDTPRGLPEGGPPLPVPSRPTGCTSSAAAATSPDHRLLLLEAAAAIIGDRAAQRPGTRDPAATARVVARGVIADRHQDAYATITANPTVTATELAETLEPSRNDRPRPLPPIHADPSIADLAPPPIERIPDQLRTQGREAVAALRQRHQPPGDDAA